MKKTQLLYTGIILDKKIILPLYGTLKRVLEVNYGIRFDSKFEDLVFIYGIGKELLNGRVLIIRDNEDDVLVKLSEVTKSFLNNPSIIEIKKEFYDVTIQFLEGEEKSYKELQSLRPKVIPNNQIVSVEKAVHTEETERSVVFDRLDVYNALKSLCDEQYKETFFWEGDTYYVIKKKLEVNNASFDRLTSFTKEIRERFLNVFENSSFSYLNASNINDVPEDLRHKFLAYQRAINLEEDSNVISIMHRHNGIVIFDEGDNTRRMLKYFNENYSTENYSYKNIYDVFVINFQ